MKDCWLNKKAAELKMGGNFKAGAFEALREFLKECNAYYNDENMISKENLSKIFNGLLGINLEDITHIDALPAEWYDEKDDLSYCETSEQILDFFEKKYNKKEDSWTDEEYDEAHKLLNEVMGAEWTSYTGFREITNKTIFWCDVEMFIAGHWRDAKQLKVLKDLL